MNEPHKLTKSRFVKLLEFIRDYRIKVSSAKRLTGIGCILIGWGLIAINTVFFPPPSDVLLTEIGFVLLFTAACSGIVIHVIYENVFNGTVKKGLKDLFFINEASNKDFDAVHLTVSQRIQLIYFRGLLATGGYIAYNVAKIYFGAIDNSEIFGADALVYALLAFLLLKERFNLMEIAGIIISSFGVFFVLFFDINNFRWLDFGLVAGFAGILSALSMTLILFITGIIVRHDSPKKAAFHQCIMGIILSLFVLCITLASQHFTHDLNFPSLTRQFIQSSIVSGIIYGTALVYFLKAFLYTEPIIIAISGYSLSVFVILLEWLFKGSFYELKSGISAFLIGFGSVLLVFEEYKKDKKLASKKFEMQQPVYQAGLNEELANLRRKFDEGYLDQYTYLSEIHEFNKLLLEYSSQIKNTDIESIQILQDTLVFKFKKPIELELETDGGARSAPFEILNFGSYEPEDEYMAYNLIQDGQTIIDVGAHIGWYVINFAKRFPQSKIVAFEPIAVTFEFLKRNAARNHVDNVVLLNYDCFNKEEEKILYYFKSGRALASIENLINHENAKKIKCKLVRLDRVIPEMGIPSVDFIKCDAEGSELFVFEGARDLITRHEPIILTELYEGWCQAKGYSTTDIVHFFKQMGYTPFQAARGRLQEVTMLAFSDVLRYNYFFLHEDKHSDLIVKYKL